MDHSEQHAMGDRAHRLGVVANGLLALLKILGGLGFRSQALLADGLHSLADMLTTAIAWASYRIAARPADDDHNYGHGKAEALAAVLVGMALLGGSVALVASLFGPPQEPYAGFEASAAIAVALVSVFVNEGLYRVAKRAAQAVRSPSLEAVARDNRSDSLSSLVVILGVVGSLLGLPQAELVAAGSIGVLIGILGLRSCREGLDILMDRVTDPHLRGRIQQCAEGVPGVVAVQRIAVHPLGRASRVDLELSVEASLTVQEGHEIAHNVERQVVSMEAQISEVSVHINPA